MDGTQKKIVAVVAALLIVIVAIAGVFVLTKESSSNDELNDEDLITSDWQAILNDAKGQSIEIAFYEADPQTKQFLAYMKDEMKSKYDISVSWSEYGPVATGIVKNEFKNGVTTGGKYDLIWGDTTMFANVISTVSGAEYDYIFDKTVDGKGWVNALPNSKYLSDHAEDMVSSIVSGYKSGSAAEFSNGETMYIYNPDYSVYQYNNEKVPYNVVMVKDEDNTGFVKVGYTGSLYNNQYESTISAASSSSTVYSILSVRQYMTSNFGTVQGHVFFGLPDNFSDLYQWAQIYRGQFTYPDATNSSATFHTNLILSAIMYELQYENQTAKTGWAVAEDKDLNIERVDKALASISSKEEFTAEFGYLYNYLADLDKYTNKSIGYNKTGTVSEINGKMIGCNNEKDYGSGTVLIGLTTVASVDMRTDAYACSIAAYAFDSCCSSQYYLLIPDNSSHKSAAMVLANWMLEPSVQAEFYLLTGNSFNIDTSKTADGDSADIWTTYFADGVSDWTRYVPIDRHNEVTIVGQPLGKASLMDTIWHERIGN